jgi:predicted transposase YbfD/YdcC
MLLALTLVCFFANGLAFRRAQGQRPRILAMTPNQALKDKLAAAVSRIDDPRLKRRQRHNLVDIVAIAICSVIASCDTFTDMEMFANEKMNWLRSFLELPNGTPSHDTFARVLGLIDREQLYDCFKEWTREVAKVLDESQHVIAVDGKCLKGSKMSESNPLWIVSAWASEHRILLGQVEVDKKSNEISALPNLLDALDLEGAIITADALNCQRSIVEKIVKGGGDYAIAVKGNQPLLSREIQGVFYDDSIGFEHFDLFETREKGHGREEWRECHACSGPSVREIGERLGWASLQSIAMLISTRVVDGKKSQEVRYYISSLEGGSIARTLAQAIRLHWGIENSLHWVLDVCFGEDRRKVLARNAAANQAALRRFAASLLQRETTAKVGIAAKRLKAAFNTGYIEQILSLA